MVQALRNIDVKRSMRDSKLSNDRIRQITSLLYYYRTNVKSQGLLSHQSRELQENLVRRPAEHCSYYIQLEQIISFFDYLKKIVDNWFPIAYTTDIAKKP